MASERGLPRVREEPILRVTIAATPRNRDIFATSAVDAMNIQRTSTVGRIR